jgi:hypothetical protein
MPERFLNPKDKAPGFLQEGAACTNGVASARCMHEFLWGNMCFLRAVIHKVAMPSGVLILERRDGC